MISIGPRDELKRSEKAGEIGLKYVKTIDGIELYSMFFPPRPGTRGRTTWTVALLGADDYVTIGDENEQFSELLLSIGRRLTEEHKKRAEGRD